jgi:CRP-like cAMP-binding protein
MVDSALTERISREVFFSGFTGEPHALAWELRRLAGVVEDLVVDAGSAVFRDGDPSEELYFVVTGEVKMQRLGARDWVFGARSLVGTLDVVLDRPRSRTAVATAPTHLLRMRAADWLDLLEDSFDLTRRVLANFASGVHSLRRRPPPLGGFDESPIRVGLPPDVVNLVDVILFLRRVPLFARASIQALTSLAALADEVQVDKGEVVVSREKFCSQLTVVISGEVLASAGADEPTGRFGRGVLVCGAAALGRASYDVRAVDATRAMVLPIEDYFDVMEEHFSLVRSALMALAEEREILLDRSLPLLTG